MSVLRARMITTNNYFAEMFIFLKDTYVLQLCTNFICYPSYQFIARRFYNI